MPISKLRFSRIDSTFILVDMRHSVIADCEVVLRLIYAHGAHFSTGGTLPYIHLARSFGYPSFSAPASPAESSGKILL